MKVCRGIMICSLMCLVLTNCRTSKLERDMALLSASQVTYFDLVYSLDTYYSFITFTRKPYVYFETMVPYMFSEDSRPETIGNWRINADTLILMPKIEVDSKSRYLTDSTMCTYTTYEDFKDKIIDDTGYSPAKERRFLIKDSELLELKNWQKEYLLLYGGSENICQTVRNIANRDTIAAKYKLVGKLTLAEFYDFRGIDINKPNSSRNEERNYYSKY